MPTLQLRDLIELAEKSFEFEALTGPIKSAGILLDPEVLKRFDAQFKGAFCIVIHDPQIDASIHSYLSGGGIADDSGASIMLLYEPISRRARAPAPVPGLGPTALSRPMIDFVRGLMPESPVALPGMLVLPRLSQSGNPIYIPLDAVGQLPEAAARMRKLLGIVAAHVDRAAATLDTDGVGRALALAGIPYRRGAMRSPSELLLVALRALWDARKDLAAVISGGAKLIGKKP